MNTIIWCGMSDIDLKSGNANWRERRRINREEKKAQTAKYYESMRKKNTKSNDKSCSMSGSENKTSDDISINIDNTVKCYTISENEAEELEEIHVDNSNPHIEVSKFELIQQNTVNTVNYILDTTDSISNIDNEKVEHNLLIKTMTDNYMSLLHHISDIETELSDTEKFIKSLDVEKKSFIDKSIDVKQKITFNVLLTDLNNKIQQLVTDIEQCDLNIYTEQNKLNNQIIAKNYALGRAVPNRELSTYFNPYINKQFMRRVELHENIEKLYLEIDDLKNEQKRLEETDWDIMIHDVQISIDSAKIKYDNITCKLEYNKNIVNNIAILLKLEKLSLAYKRYAKYYNITLSFDINTLNINDDNYYENLIEIIVSCNYHHQDYLLYQNENGKGYFANIKCGNKDINGNICNGFWTNGNSMCECGKNIFGWNDNNFTGLEIEQFTINSRAPYGFPEQK